MKIKNGLVFCADHHMRERDLCFENGIITEFSSSGLYDARGCYVLPGFIDTHIHGAASVSFSLNTGSIRPALDWLSNRGITALLPTLVAENRDEYLRDLALIRETGDHRVLGVHLEGPFLNPVRKGGIPAEKLRSPSAPFLESIDPHGQVKVLTLAPELEGADQVLTYCRDRGIRTSMGHTMATCEEAAAAADKGMTGATHLFNAMRPFNHREPGVIGCALTDPRITCELICDLRHVSAPAVRLAVRAKGIDRITMISDGDFFSGLPEGAYTWGSQTLTVSDGLCYLPDGTIRGSAQTLADGVKNMFDLGFRPEEIAVMACVNPAKACGCTDRGELIPGNRADIVILDRDFRVKDVFLGGILRNP